MESVPKLAPPGRSPIKRKPQLAENSSALHKPAERISPFKGKMGQMSPQEIFSTTPRRLLNFKSQSVDRYGFSSANLNENTSARSNNNQRQDITFESLKRMAPSKSLGTPSRMVVGKREPQSERISRLTCPTVSSSRKKHEEPSVNLLDRFKANKSILKRPLSPPSEEEEEKVNSISNVSEISVSSLDNDLTTTLNTLRNTGAAKDVLNLLSDMGPSQQKKRKRAVTFDQRNETEDMPSSQISDTLKLILRNQEEIMRRLDILETER